jgi:hypothetical protein
MPSPYRFRAGTAVAAAVLLLALSGALWLVLRGAAPRGGPPTIRPVTAARVEAGRPLLLAWEGGGPPFRVFLLGQGHEPLWESERLTAAMVEVPAPVRDRLNPGQEYHWEVEGKDSLGRTFRSEPFPLTLERVQL